MKPSVARILPFALFMGFILLQEIGTGLMGWGGTLPDRRMLMFLYPARAVVVGTLLFLLRRHYSEIDLRDLLNPGSALAAVGTGLVVFVLWVNMDWSRGAMGAGVGFDPTLFQPGWERTVMIGFRMAGLVIVVAVMEELFWRSFFLRWLINSDFEMIPLGMFTWGSFIGTAVLFGLEHTMILAGIVAGLFYNLLLYYRKSISCCILSHAVTNFALCIYILNTRSYHLW